MCCLLRSDVWPLTYQCVACYVPTCGLLHIDVWPVTYRGVACDVARCSLLRTNVWSVTYRRVACYVTMCGLLRTNVWHFKYRCVASYVPMCGFYVPMCGLLRTDVWPVTYKCVACYVPTCGLLRTDVWPVTYRYMACYISMCGWVSCFETIVCFRRVSEISAVTLRGTRLIMTCSWHVSIGHAVTQQTALQWLVSQLWFKRVLVINLLSKRRPYRVGCGGYSVIPTSSWRSLFYQDRSIVTRLTFSPSQQQVTYILTNKFLGTKDKR
jgi:hypothetical protein